MYLPKDKRQPDFQYGDHLARILREGTPTKHPFQKEGRRVLLTLPPLVYKLENGVPLITDRYLPFSKTLSPISEMFAFVNGVRKGAEMLERGVRYWQTWVKREKTDIFGLEPDDMGDGSYGPGFNQRVYTWEDVPGHPDGGRFRVEIFHQFDHLVKQIKEMPYLSTHKVTCWTPHYCLQHKTLQRKVVVAPCHGDIQITILGNKLNLTMTQRSGDYPVGVPADIFMYAALTIGLGQVTGFEPDNLIIRVVDAHIYEDQIPEVEDMVWADKQERIRRVPKPFPTLTLTDEGKEIRDINEFRAKHFLLQEYEYHPARNIPVTE